jgi:hypothetical protein
MRMLDEAYFPYQQGGREYDDEFGYAPAAGIIAAAMRWGLRHIPLAALL